jgi:hypothetical protein
MGAGSPTVIRPFEVYRVPRKGKWYFDFVHKLVNEYGLPSAAFESHKLRALLYHAHRLGTRRIVIHCDYTCRDYQADYASMYARMARPPRQRCVRLMFFNRTWTEKQIAGSLPPAFPLPSDHRASAVLNGIGKDSGLVGIAVLRPTAGCLIGRTVMAFAGEEDGYLTCEQSYGCHLYGTPLSVAGAPWLEQDPALFVCGGAALWFSAYHTETRLGLPHLSPGELTALTRRHWVTGHVSGGMTEPEIANALQSWGFQPYTYAAQRGDPDSMQRLVNYVHFLVESNIPVILGYWWGDKDSGPGHAVTAVGHTLASRPRADVRRMSGSIRATTDWVDRFVVLNDQEAPYWHLPIVSGQHCEQPLSRFKAGRWAGVPIENTGPETRALGACEVVRMFAPLNPTVQTSPDHVLALSRKAVRQAAGWADLQPTRKLKSAWKRSFLPLIGKPHCFAFRPRLLDLWQFHWDLKASTCWKCLSPLIREWYLNITWPISMWAVQIVRLGRCGQDDNPNGGVSWEHSTVVGEILIDATESPWSGNSVFSIRLGPFFAYFPDGDTSMTCFCLEGGQGLEYPMV